MSQSASDLRSAVQRAWFETSVMSSSRQAADHILAAIVKEAVGARTPGTWNGIAAGLDEYHAVNQSDRRADAPMSVEDRYLYGNVEAAARVADRLHAAVEHLRACEVEGKAGADDQLILDALFSYEAFKRANA